MDTVLNWLWQGGAVALAAAAGLRSIPKSRPHARYALIWIAYAAVLALPATRLLTLASPVPSPVDPLTTGGPAVTIPVAWWTSSTLMLALWLTWFGARSVRFATAVIALRATKRTSLECPPGLEARLPLWSRLRSTGRPTRLVVSDRVRSAAVLGWGEPVIALAPVLLERLDPADLDRVVLHEWSHVQRRDDRAQLVQQALRTVIGWHPTVWWLERQLELEREAACDLTTVALTGSAKQYAACLATLAALPPSPVRLMPALAAASPSGLRQRVVRILSHSIGTRRWRANAVAASVALVPLALAVSSVQVVEAVLEPVLLPATTWHAIVSAVSAPVTRIGSLNEELSTAPERPLRRPTAPAQSESVSNHQPAIQLQEANVPSVVEASIPTPVVSQPEATASPEVPTEVPASPPVISPEPPTLSVAAVDPPSAQPAKPDPAADTGLAPWTAAAEAGVAIGRGSQIAGVKTAGFFSRLGKRIAGSF